MRIAYGVVTTGKGHLARLLPLIPLFRTGGHELLILISGPGTLPPFVEQTLRGVRVERFEGLEMVPDGQGGISKRQTLRSVTTSLPTFLDELRRAHKSLAAFSPDLIVSDFDPITGSPFVCPGVLKIGLGNHAAQKLPAAMHVQGQTLQRWKVDLVVKLFTFGLDDILGCHFFPLDESCLPPILRPCILEAVPENHGHLVVYHSFARCFEPIRAYAARHPTVPIFVYGYPKPLKGTPENIVFESDSCRFVKDLATSDAFVGTAGFQAISEAFFLKKRIVVQPIEGHYEQAWNAAQLEIHGMGRQCRGDLAAALDQSFNHSLHDRLAPWYRNGAAIAYERLLSFIPSAKSEKPSDTALVNQQ